MSSRKVEYRSIIWNLRIFVVADELSWRGPITHSQFNQVVKDIRSSIHQTVYRRTEPMARDARSMTGTLSKAEARYQCDLEVWRYFFVRNGEVTRDLPGVVLDRGYQACCDEQRDKGVQHQKPIQLQGPSRQQQKIPVQHEQQSNLSTSVNLDMPLHVASKLVPLDQAVSQSAASKPLAAPKPSPKAFKQNDITRDTRSKTKKIKILLDQTKDLETRIHEKELEEENLRATGYAEWERLMDLARETKTDEQYMAFKNEAERVNEEYSNKGDCLSIDAAGLRMELNRLGD